MRRTFRLHLPNGAFGDPLLVLRVRWLPRVLLFDCGDTSALTGRTLLDVTDVLLSHSHVDHAFGLARVLRTRLGNPHRPLRVFGPRGTAGRIASHLSGYTWNLVTEYPLSLEVWEVEDDRLMGWCFPRTGGFDPFVADVRERERCSAVFEDELLRIDACPLEHGSIPSVAYRVEEHLSLNVDTGVLDRLGLEPGPWLAQLKRAIRAGADDLAAIETPRGRVPARELREALIVETPGDCVTFATDISASVENGQRLSELARDARLLVLESSFIESDRDLARRHAHLTTGDAAALARRIGPDALCPFHFSERYADDETAVWSELERLAQPVRVLRLPGVVDEREAARGRDSECGT
jgi:ribonuclease Z